MIFMAPSPWKPGQLQQGQSFDVHLFCFLRFLQGDTNLRTNSTSGNDAFLKPTANDQLSSEGKPRY
jgi:hypothetical protein